MEKIMIQKAGEMKVASIHITEDELVEAFQQASRKLMDEFAEKKANQMHIMMDGLRDVLVCHKLTEILFAVDEAAESEEEPGCSENLGS